MKNYYKIMGLKVTASDAEIKSAFRLLAKRYHPDVNPGNEQAAEKFADLNEAYETLGDPEKKAEYDRAVNEMLTGHAQNGYAQNGYAQGGYAQNGYAQNGYAQGGAYARARFAQSQQQAQQQFFQKMNEAQRNGYNKGYETGFNDAQARLSAENENLRSQLSSIKSSGNDVRLKTEIERLKKLLDDTEADLEAMKAVREDEAEDFKLKISQLESENERLKSESVGKERKLAGDSATVKTLREKLSAAELKANESRKQMLATERKLSEATAGRIKAETLITDLKLELSRTQSERKYYEDESVKAKTSLREKEDEIELLNQTIVQWEDFAKSLDTADAMKSIKSEWDKKVRDAKKRIKNTHYGTLGVLFFSDDEEIKESFRKLVKRYQKKAETDKSAEEKLIAVGEAYKVLSDPDKRAQYNAEIGIDDSEIAQMIEEKAKHDDNMTRLKNEQDEQEFWAYIEELMYNAQVGDAESQNVLGEMYYYGDELEKDLEQAVYWFKEAAKQKYPDAFYNLGVCFLVGEGVDRDETKAKGFIKQAAKLGNAAAQELINADFDIYAEPLAAASGK